MTITSAWFRSGTVSVTHDNKYVQGFSTAWVNHLTPIGVGDAFTTDFQTLYEVVEVVSDTQIKLDRAYEGVSASKVPYGIIRNGSSNFSVRTASAVQKSLAWYQQQLGTMEKLLTEDGDIVVELPDGTEVTLWSEAKKQAQFEAKIAAFDQMQTEKAAGFDSMQAGKDLAFDAMQAECESEHDAAQTRRDSEFQVELDGYKGSIAALENGVMTKVEFEALREQRKRESASGSGVKEPGKHPNSSSSSTEIINEGMWTYLTSPKSLRMGRGEEYADKMGSSQTLEPVVVLDGIQVHVGGTVVSSEEQVSLNVPDAPDATKTINSKTGDVRKYTNQAGVGEQYDAHTVDFDNKAYIKLPAFTLPADSKIEFKFVWDGHGTERKFIVCGYTDVAKYFRIGRNDEGDVLRWAGFHTVTMNGSDITSQNDTLVPEAGVEYHITAITNSEFGIEHIGSYANGNERFFGQIWDFKTIDAVTGELRHYPILEHKVVDGQPLVQTKVENIAEENPREGWVANYDRSQRVPIPDFPLADAMDLSVSFRPETNQDVMVFGMAAIDGTRLYVSTHPESGSNYVQVGVGTTAFSFHPPRIGVTYHTDISIRKNAGKEDYTVSVTVNGETQSKADVGFEGVTVFNRFALGQYGNGDGRGWRGQIYDFRIQYPDMPDMNRYYAGFDSEDPQGRLTIKDEDGFSDKDWGLNYTLAQGGFGVIPTFSATNFDYEGMVSYTTIGNKRNELSGQLGSPSTGDNKRCYFGKRDDDTIGFGWGSLTDSAEIPVVVGQMYHCKMEVRGTTAKCYVNGKLTNTINSSAVSILDGMCTGATLGNNLDSSNRFVEGSKVWDIRLTDIDNPENIRHYPLTTNQQNKPANTFPIIDKQYNKETAPFYAPVYRGGGVRHVAIPTWTPSASSSIKFKYVTSQVNVLEHLLSGEGVNSCKVVMMSQSNKCCIGIRANSSSNIINFTDLTFDVNQEVEIELALENGSWQCWINGVKGGHKIPNGNFVITEISSRVSGNYLRGRLWDLELIDNTEPTNCRYYPCNVYSPAAVPTENVLTQTEYLYKSSSDLVADGWGATSGATLDGKVITLNSAGGQGASTAYLPTMKHGLKYTVDYDFEVVGNNVTTVQLRNGRNNGSVTPYTFLGTEAGIYKGSWTFTAQHVDAINRADAIYIRIVGDAGTTINVKALNIKSADGEFVNFPAGGNWELAQVSNLTGITPKNFRGNIWNNDLIRTDASMIGFDEPWKVFSTALHGEVVGNSTWVSSALQASQKAFDYAGRTPDVNVITSRKDFVFLEVWDEKVSDTGVVFPFGNTQYGSGSWEGMTTLRHADMGIANSYSAFGEWDYVEEGTSKPIYGFQLSRMTDKQLAKFFAHPENNCYFDQQEGELHQIHYRFRVVEGLRDEWSCVNPMRSAVDSSRNWLAHFPAGSNNLYVVQRGKKSDARDYYKQVMEGGIIFGGSGRSGFDTANIAVFQNTDKGSGTSDDANKGCYALPIALIQRLNQGAYHPACNPQGTKSWRQHNGGNYYKWFQLESNGERNLTIQEAFLQLTNESASHLRGAYIYSGHVGVGRSGRNDQYAYHDVVYAGLVEDLRLSVNKQDYSRLLTDSVRKALAGKTRGRGKVPFTTMHKITNAVFADSFEITSGFSPYDGNEGFYTRTTSSGNDTTYSYQGYKHFYWVGDNGNTYLFTNGKGGGKSDFKQWIPYTTGVVYGMGCWKSNEFVEKQTELQTLFPQGTHVTVYAIKETELSAEYDSLPWVDIFGSPNDISTVFPNGVVGEWAGDGKTTPAYLNRKADKILTKAWTEDGGQTWITASDPSYKFDTVTNAMDETINDTAVRLVIYSTASDFTEPDENRSVKGCVGKVVTPHMSDVHRGNRIAPSLTGTINRSTQSGWEVPQLNLLNFAIDPSNRLTNSTALRPEHAPLTLGAPTNNSDAVKALPHLVSKDGLLYVQYHAAQLVHNGTDWGDDSKFTIVNGETTKTDLNGNAIKVVTHIELLPIGIAYNN